MARKGCYLYVQTCSLFLRLNLGDLCESDSSAEFEIAHDYSTSYGRVPIGMGCIVVGSKIYMVGGENTMKDSHCCRDWDDEETWLNTTDVYVFDPTKPESESEDRLVPVRDGAVVGKLNGPKTKPKVFTLEGKFYLLSQIPFLGSIDDHECPFEVFDPTLPIPSWKALPHQPKFPVKDYFAWGHKLLTFPDISIFDARDEKWQNGWNFVKQFKRKPFPIGAAVEFKGVVFAVSIDMNALVAYDLDASGQLNAHWVLDELSEVFEGRPIDDPSQGFLTHIGGGRMCLLFAWHDERGNWFIRVQVFQVYITTGGDSPPDRPAVNREIMRTFDLRSWNNSSVIYSVFMCDHSNKSDIQADASSGLYSCEGSKKHAEHAVRDVKRGANGEKDVESLISACQWANMEPKNLTQDFLFQLSVLVAVRPTFEAVATSLYGDCVDDKSVFVVDGVGDAVGDDLLLWRQNVE